ncbi:unnamed protein product, partial [Durusdinium trenchii]
MSPCLVAVPRSALESASLQPGIERGERCECAARADKEKEQEDWGRSAHGVNMTPKNGRCDSNYTEGNRFRGYATIFLDGSAEHAVDCTMGSNIAQIFNSGTFSVRSEFRVREAMEGSWSETATQNRVLPLFDNGVGFGMDVFSDQIGLGTMDGAANSRISCPFTFSQGEDYVVRIFCTDFDCAVMVENVVICASVQAPGLQFVDPSGAGLVSIGTFRSLDDQGSLMSGGDIVEQDWRRIEVLDRDTRPTPQPTS